MCAASQVLFITFGACSKTTTGSRRRCWRSDVLARRARFGSSSLASSRTDRWGKERSVLGGLALMAIAGAADRSRLVARRPGAVIVFIAGFEFAIVSLPMGGELVAGRPGTGIGLFFAATASSRSGDDPGHPAVRVRRLLGLCRPRCRPRPRCRRHCSPRHRSLSRSVPAAWQSRRWRSGRPGSAIGIRRHRGPDQDSRCGQPGRRRCPNAEGSPVRPTL